MIDKYKQKCSFKKKISNFPMELYDRDVWGRTMKRMVDSQDWKQKLALNRHVFFGLFVMCLFGSDIFRKRK